MSSRLSRGHRSRKFHISPGALAAGASLPRPRRDGRSIGAAGYLMFRDDLLAGLIDRQTQMQYAYEDRIAALRLRLDQLASRQFIDQDGVEGKVQSLVLRQAHLETRAAVVAQLVERTISRAPASPWLPRSAPMRLARQELGRRSPRRAGCGAAAAPNAPRARSSGVLSYAGKPERRDYCGSAANGSRFRCAPPNAAPKQGELMPIDSSSRRSRRPAPLAHAADPDVPMPTRLQTLARLARPDRARSGAPPLRHRPPRDGGRDRLRRAFDIAGLPVDRYVQGRRTRSGSAIGGPFVARRQRDRRAFRTRSRRGADAPSRRSTGCGRALPMTPLRKPLAGEFADDLDLRLSHRPLLRPAGAA